MKISQNLKELFEEKKIKFREIKLPEEQDEISKIYIVGYKNEKNNYKYTISFTVFDEKEEIIILVPNMYNMKKSQKNENFYELINSFNVETFYGKVFFTNIIDSNEISISYTHIIGIKRNQDIQDVLGHIKDTRSQVRSIIGTLRENGFDDKEKL